MIILINGDQADSGAISDSNTAEQDKPQLVFAIKDLTERIICKFQQPYSLEVHYLNVYILYLNLYCFRIIKAQPSSFQKWIKLKKLGHCRLE